MPYILSDPSCDIITKEVPLNIFDDPTGQKVTLQLQPIPKGKFDYLRGICSIAHDKWTAATDLEEQELLYEEVSKTKMQMIKWCVMGLEGCVNKDGTPYVSDPPLDVKWMGHSYKNCSPKDYDTILFSGLYLYLWNIVLAFNTGSLDIIIDALHRFEDANAKE